MPSNPIRECPTYFKRCAKNSLQTKHGISDALVNAMKDYSCKYCKKYFSRSIKCCYHKKHCKPRKPGNGSYRHNSEFGTETERNRLRFNQILVVYTGT